VTHSASYRAALDDLTVDALRRSSPPDVLAEHDADLAAGVSAYDHPDLRPPARARRCCPQCADLFWPSPPWRVYCCHRCRWLAHYRRHTPRILAYWRARNAARRAAERIPA